MALGHHFSGFSSSSRSSLRSTRASRAAKRPFHPQDVLPLLPRQVSWPILNSLRRPWTCCSPSSAWLPPSTAAELKGACFYKNTAWMEFHSKTGSEFGGGTLHIKVASVMTVWNQMQPAYAASIWKEALNKRLGTEGLDMPDLLVETGIRGLSFAELLTIPEQNDGKSASQMCLFDSVPLDDLLMVSA